MATLTPDHELSLREQIVRIDHMIVDMQRIAADRDRKRQEMYWAPWQVITAAVTAMAAVFAAGAAVGGIAVKVLFP